MAAVLGACSSGGASSSSTPATLRFGIGPYQPTATDTRKAWEPFFAYVAKQVGAKYELEVTNDFGGIAVALGSKKVDLAWLGPYGYVIANHSGGAKAIATANYDGKPVYHSIVIGPPDSPVRNYPDDAKGMSMSFAEVDSTSGWLVPTYFLKTRNIDPHTWFKYSEGAAHPAQETAVAARKVDLATDYDRNRTAMIEGGEIKDGDTKVVWTSPDLPNDAIAVRSGLSPSLAKKLQEVITKITPEQAATLLPKHYDGFVVATDDTYKIIRDAATSLNKLAG
ncbi:MAG: phosphate/phosphite/phosphonate ABC transporter substrate-binding protein [Acidimicrobiales bacterium]